MKNRADERTYIVLIGGTGYLGNKLVDQFKSDFNVIVVTRNPEKYVSDKCLYINHQESYSILKDFKIDMIINLSSKAANYQQLRDLYNYNESLIELVDNLKSINSDIKFMNVGSITEYSYTTRKLYTKSKIRSRNQFLQSNVCDIHLIVGMIYEKDSNMHKDLLRYYERYSRCSLLVRDVHLPVVSISDFMVFMQNIIIDVKKNKFSMSNEPVELFLESNFLSIENLINPDREKYSIKSLNKLLQYLFLFIDYSYYLMQSVATDKHDRLKYLLLLSLVGEKKYKKNHYIILEDIRHIAWIENNLCIVHVNDKKMVRI